MYAGVSSVNRGGGDQSLGVFPKCSVTNQCNFGQPYKTNEIVVVFSNAVEK